MLPAMMIMFTIIETKPTRPRMMEMMPQTKAATLVGFPAFLFFMKNTTAMTPKMKEGMERNVKMKKETTAREMPTMAQTREVVLLDLFL